MKVRKKQNQKHLLCVASVIFRSNKVRPMRETNSTKATAVGKSNNVGVGAQIPQRPTRVRGRIPRRWGDFTQLFFPKMRIFRHILV